MPEKCDEKEVPDIPVFTSEMEYGYSHEEA
jgi:hypothetical protein